MTTQTLENKIPERVTLDNPDVLHTAHIDCQLDSFFVKMCCGREFAWDDMELNSPLPPCQACEEALECPSCGLKFKMP